MTPRTNLVAGGLKVSEYLLALDDQVRAGARQSETLLFSTRSGALLAVPTGTWKSLVEGRTEPVNPELVARLRAAEILVPSEQDEYTHLALESRLKAASGTTLLRVILPTSQCNLGCVYCGQGHVSKEISTEVRERLLVDIEAQLRTRAFKRLQITWFGGEPSTAPNAVRGLSAAFLELCSRYGVSYGARMITNGVALSSARAEEFHLRDEVLAFDISLDGPRDVHDRRRPLRGHGSSYERIVANLTAISANPKLAGCALTIRVNVDRANAPLVTTLIDDLADCGLAERVGLYFALVVDWNHNRREELLLREEFADLEIGWLVHAIERGFKPSLLPKRRYSACLAAETASAVVATDGTVHNCTMTPLAEHAITDTTRPLGTVGTDLSHSSAERHREIFTKLDGAELECRSCRFLFLCQGGCPKDLDAGELPCPSFKFNMGSRMLLQYAGFVSRSADRGFVAADCNTPRSESDT